MRSVFPFLFDYCVTGRTSTDQQKKQLERRDGDGEPGHRAPLLCLHWPFGPQHDPSQPQRSKRAQSRRTRPAIAGMAETDIDSLLERYLRLLDEYVGLQEKLSELHSGIFQNLAKTNFTAPRGVRYGQDYYDGRMQAVRKVALNRQDSSSPAFEITNDKTWSTAPELEPLAEAEVEAKPDRAEEGEKGDNKKSQQQQKASGDPLRWFGILTPMPLRQAQKLAIESVEDIVPRLATVNTQMVAVELEIRRARKRRAKAEKMNRHQDQPEISPGRDKAVA